jgi:two-component system, OmpR family, sensor kinase
MRDVPFVFGDIGLIERVLQNLIDNAVQYTPDGGAVGVAVSTETGAGVKFAVTDTGKGISKQDLPYIYDRFYRSASVREKSSSGLGLGLAISKKMIELHGATLDVRSVENEGTMFSFVLPLYLSPNETPVSKQRADTLSSAHLT